VRVRRVTGRAEKRAVRVKRGGSEVEWAPGVRPSLRPISLSKEKLLHHYP
jgi:hypothetical protein